MTNPHARESLPREIAITAEGVREKRDNRRVATTSYLDRILDPLTDVFTPEVASAVLRLRADSETEARIAELRGRAKEEFVEAVDVISIIQTKARRFLARNPS